MDTIQFKRRIGLELLIFISMVSLTVLLLKPVESYTRIRMGVLRDSFISMAESTLNRNIRYSSASPSILGSIDVRDITIFRTDGEPTLELDRFRLKYSIGALLTGRKTAAVRSIDIEGLNLVYDLDTDNDLAELFTGKTDKTFQLPEECLVQVRNGSILVKKDEKSLHITGLSFDGEIKDGRIILDGKWHTEAVLAGITESLKTITVDGILEGNFSGDFSDGSLILGILSLTTETFSLENLFCNFSFRDNIVEFDFDALNLLLAYDTDSGILSGNFNPYDFTLSEILVFTGDWKRYDPWLDFVLSGSASFSFDGKDRLDYRFGLKGRGTQTFLSGFDIDCSGDNERIVFTTCALSFYQGMLNYTGDILFNPLLPNGIIRFSEFSLTESPGISGEVRLIRGGRNVDIFAEDFFVGGVLLSAISGGLRREGSGYTWQLEMLRFKNIESYEDVELATLSMNGSYNPSSGENRLAQLEGSVALDLFSLADISAMVVPFYKTDFQFLVQDTINNITVTTEVFFSTDFIHATYSAPRCVAVHEGFSDTFVVVSISGTDGHFEVTDGRVSWTKGAVDISLQADFSDPANCTFFFQTSYRDFTYYFEGSLLDNRTLNVRGSYGVSAYINSGNGGGYSGYVNIDSVPVPFQGKIARLSVDVSINIGSPSFWTVDINKLELREVENPDFQFVNLLVSGQANQDGLIVEKLFFIDRLGELSGSIRSEWENDFSRAKGILVLSDGDTENYVLEAAYDSGGDAFLADSGNTGKIAFGVQLEDVRLERFTAGGKNGRLSGMADGIWNGADSYSINVNLKSLEMQGEGGMPVSISAGAFMDAKQISISASGLALGQFAAPALAVTVDRSQSRLAITGQLQGDIKGRSLGLDGSLNVSFAPIDSWFNIGKAFRSFSGTLDIESAHVGNNKLAEACSFSFSRSRDAVSVSGGPGDMLKFELLRDGSLYTDLSSPSPVQAYLSGTMKDFNLDVMADDVYIDLSALWSLLPMDEVVVFTGGFIIGQTRITGSLWDPEFSGHAWGSGVRLIIPDYIGAEIGPGSDEIILEGSEISFGPVKGRCGNGSGEITASIRFNRWVPSFDLFITVPEEAPVPFGFDIAGFKAAGNASGNLNFFLENSETLTITGEVNTEDTEITLNAEKIQAMREEQRSSSETDIVSNVRVNAGRRTEFMWPSEEMPVLRAFGAAGSGIRIISDSRVPTFALDGDIILQGGEIFYIQRSFFIREGQVFFNPNDSNVDPYITTRAEIRDRTDEGNVVISMIIDYSPLSLLVPRFESTPPLSQLEIYSLLGQIPEEGAQSEVVLRTMADMLAQFTLVRRVERGIRNVLGLDMFTFRTQVLQNAILQALDISRGPDQPRSTMGNYLDNTAVFVGKYIAPDLFVQAIGSLRYDQFQEAYGGLRLEPDIGLELRTPLAGVQWNLNPRNFENFNVSDIITGQSFSLIWRWTF